MVMSVISDCLVFFGFLLVLLLGFALAIHIMLRGVVERRRQHEDEAYTSRNTGHANNNDQDAAQSWFPFRRNAGGDDDVPDVSKAFGSYKKSVLTLFYALFGQIDPEVTNQSSHAPTAELTQVYSVEHELTWMVTTTFAIYMLAQVIVFLNLLISIMGDTFERVKSNEEGQMLMARAMIIDSCEASATKKEMDEIM